MLHTDICIAGAGVIGLSLALELQARNLSVIVLEAGQPLREASWAAAGMLAAHDPHNPSEISALAELSVSLYPRFLGRIEAIAGIAVPFQTSHTLQSTQPPGSRHEPLALPLPASMAPAYPVPTGFELLDERSIDPRQLSVALLAAIAATSIRLHTNSPVLSTTSTPTGVHVATPTETIEAANFIDSTGAWANDPGYCVVPIKGQMLAVELPASFPMKTAVRTADIYVVPRTTGPGTGRAIIGATVEDVGFDKTVDASQIEDLRQRAIALLPALAHAKMIDSWSGLRPAMPDRLPLLGPHPIRPHHWVATGHYRNGMLLAPATACVMAEVLLSDIPSVEIDAFSPSRLTLRGALPRSSSCIKA